MSKGPTPRHSKPPKPVTIDLDATDVTPKEVPGAAKGTPTVDQAAAKAVETASGQLADNKAAAPGAGATDSASKFKPTQPAGGADSESKSEATATARAETASKGTPRKETESADKADVKQTDPASPQQPSSTGRPTVSNARRGGGLGLIASGVVGALIAVGGLYVLQSSGMLPAPGGDANVEALSSRIDSLSQTVDGLVAEVSAQPTADAVNLPADLTARLDALEAAATQADGAGGASAGSEALATLEARIAETETRLAALDGTAGDAAADPALAGAVSELRAAQTGLADSLAGFETRMSELSSQVSGFEQTQTDLSQRRDERLAAIEARLDEPAQQVNLARAIAAAGLKSAIDRGGSFMSELEAFAAVAPEDPAVPDLRDLAAGGVPSRADLIERFPDAASRAIAAANPGDPNAGLVDRLMTSALSVVKVRKVGDVSGDSAEAITARAEARLQEGDLEAALAEWQTLPEASQAAASDFGEALAARARAEKLIAASLAPGGPPVTAETPAN